MASFVKVTKVNNGREVTILLNFNHVKKIEPFLDNKYIPLAHTLIRMTEDEEIFVAESFNEVIERWLEAQRDDT